MTNQDNPPKLWNRIWGKMAGPYAPLIAIGLAIMLIAVFIPRGGKKASQVGPVALGTEPPTLASPGRATGASPTSAPSTKAGSVPSSVGAPLPGAVPPGVTGVGPGSPVKGGRCRTDGRMPIGTWPYAPPCVAPFSGSNGGATAPGVTSKEVRVVVYQQKNTTDQLTGPTANNADADWDRTITAYEKWFNARYETYGRHVKFMRFKSDADPSDDQAVRADAIKVANEYKAFASVWAPGSFAYCDELAARKVLCISLTGPPRDMAKRLTPYLWSVYMLPEDSSDLRSEHICKKLGGGRKAIWAGDSAFKQRPRTFAVVHIDSPGGQYQQTGKYSQTALARCGVNAELIFYTYDADNPSTLATQAPSVIAKLKNDGVTTVLCNCDPLFPIFLTTEADRNEYDPEWLVNGAGYIDIDTNVRRYSQTQWAHAFGVSVLPTSASINTADAYKAYKMVDSNGEPSAYAGWIFALMNELMIGVHGAGPRLDAFHFRDALARYPASGGTVTHIGIDFEPPARTGAIADMREIWWDPNAVGADGKTGAYRSVDGGRRYSFGQWPARDTRYFDPKGSVVYYQTPPDEARLA